MNKKTIFIITTTIILLSSLIGYTCYKAIFRVSIKKSIVIHVKPTDTFSQLCEVLQTKGVNKYIFRLSAILKNFKTPIKGKYTLKKGFTTIDVVNILRTGRGTVKVIFNNQDNLEKLAGRISQQLEVDSISILKSMKDPDFLKENGFTKETALSMYIPNKYEFYWTTTADDFRQKMLSSYNKFWNSERRDKASEQGLTPEQVIILASIVQKETAQISERPMVAGLYLNRYNNEWPLQADPTIIYALKQKYGQDKIYKRVLKRDLTIESPYNTYMVKGLPPSLIAMPDISAIEAVLNPKKHNYYYMCASTSRIGFHDFAKTLAEHNVNARKYRQWISKQGIKR